MIKNTVYIQQLSAFVDQEVTLRGWISNKRDSKGLAFIILRDGSGFCQCVADASQLGEDAVNNLKKLGLESALVVSGKVLQDERQVGGYELQVSGFEIIHHTENYPIAKKEHGVDFLMDQRHLWLRSSRQWAIMRIRNRIIFAIHNFFQSRGFVQMDAPLFTGNACEGTSNLFETDFYGDPAYLSQSGQLYGEAMAMAFGRIYTFGPTFRAEKSKTRRHLSEFWMIEPEMAFYNLFDNMDLIEEFLRAVVLDVINHCEAELQSIGRDVEMLKHVTQPFPRLTYDEAVSIIKGEKNVDGINAIESLENDFALVIERKKAVLAEIAEREEKIKTPGMKKGEISFNQNKVDTLKNELKDLEESERNLPQWLASAKNFEHGNDFGGSDETVLTRLFNVPIMVYNWPHEVKAFYLKRDPEDSRWARGVDVLAPEGYGEIVGGGERETDEQSLIEKIHEHDLPLEAFEWYLDLRRYGSVPHSGFGLGLERLVTWICKLPHVRESILFPRMYGRLLP